jgi:hypothetical protein
LGAVGAGYNWQISLIVIDVEADFLGAHLWKASANHDVTNCRASLPAMALTVAGRAEIFEII